MRSIATLLSLLIITTGAYAGDQSQSIDLPKGLQGISIGGVYYLKYQAGQENNKADNYNRFTVSRGYLTVKKEVNDFITSRLTLDTHQDDEGDMKVRVKYIYADFKLPEFVFITAPHAEFGLVHRPWLDFEEHLNYYRMIDKMFMERIDIFNSADFGFTFAGYFGGEMDKDYQKTVNKKYPGRYGSFAVGIYNGGGYHAEESNQNKTFETRLTVRPVPDVIPGLQISELIMIGKGNGSGTLDDIEGWNTYATMLSYEHRMLTMTGPYVSGFGNKKGGWSEDDNYSGYSFFAEGKPLKNWRIVGRYDFFDKEDPAADKTAETRIAGGLGYDFGHQNILIFDYEVLSYENDAKEDDNRFQLTMQIHY